MNKRGLIGLVLILMLFGVVSAGESNGKMIGFDRDDFKGGVDVVVKIRHDSKLSIMEDEEVEVSYEVVSVDEEGLDDLLVDSNVIGVYSKNYIVASMSEAVQIINSTASNNLKIDSLNLTGAGQRVCVIDTGINFLHPDLVGVNDSCVVDCYDKSCVENCSILDDNGHGTHVAGIIAASGDLVGIAPNITLIGVKILGSDGGGSGNDNDLANAVDYCVSVNSSVVSMSLGTVAFLSDSNCDAVSGLEVWRSAIDDAVSAGVAVVASSGNDANFTHISAPACFSNVIPVGDTYDANLGGVVWSECSDASTFLDKIVCHANRNSLVKLFAPGAMINSTSNVSGNYVERGGTSMAAPMVSGAIAILKQYLNFSEQSKTPLEIESVLDETGVVLEDGASGLNYSRIDVYEALLSLDVDVPVVSLVSPVNNHVNFSVNQSFVCNASDWQLANVTFKLWNSSGILYYNETKNLTGTLNETSFEVLNLSRDEWTWNCFVYDLQGNLGNATNWTFTVGEVEVRLDSPENGSSTNVNETNFSCTSFSAAEYELSNVTFKLWNSSGVLVKNESRDISGFENTTIFNWTFLEEDEYTWNCFVVNNNSDEDNDLNFSISYDITSPNVSSVSVSKTSSSAVISWNSDELANSSVWVSGGSWSNSSEYVLNHSVSVSLLSASTSYSYILYSCDAAGNCGNESGSFTTNAASSSGGGGGGSPAPSVSVVSIPPSELWVGKSEVLEEGDKISFNLNSGSHSLEVSSVGNGYVNIVVRSEPIYLTLIEGQKIKLNLSSVDYYDLVIKLEEIIDGEVNISVRRIFEVIEKEVGGVDTTLVAHENETDSGVVEDVDVGRNWNWWIVVLVVVLVVAAWNILKKKRFNRKRRAKRNRKSKKVSKRRRKYGKRKKVKVKA